MDQRDLDVTVLHRLNKLILIEGASAHTLRLKPHKDTRVPHLERLLDRVKCLEMFCEDFIVVLAMFDDYLPHGFNVDSLVVLVGEAA